MTSGFSVKSFDVAAFSVAAFAFGDHVVPTPANKLNIDFYRRASALVLTTLTPGDGKQVMLRIGRRRERRK